MRRCPRCTLQFPDSASFCARCGQGLLDLTFWQKNATAPVVIALVIAGVIVFGLMLKATSTGSTTASRTPASASAPNSNAGPQPTVKQYQWEPSSYSDDMGRGWIYAMTIKSSNTVTLDRPYQGPQHATLTIRSHPRHGNDVYISIERGQLLDSDFHARALVRFDNDKAVSFSTARPGDLSSETLFLRNSFSVFVRRLKTAKALRIEVPVYQAGNQMFEFAVEGFKWEAGQSKH